MIEFIRPMLACSLLKPETPHTDSNILAAMQKLRCPVLASVKVDGIRAIKLGDLASRTLKKIPNLSISQRADTLPYGLDTELYCSELPYDKIESIVMSRVHLDSDKILFHVLDLWDKGEGYNYEDRITTAFVETEHNLNCVPSLIKLCNNADDLWHYFQSVEEVNGEGICFRTPDSPYKMGRSTLKEQYLLKLARFVYSECTIIGFEEQMLNTNPEQVTFTGSTKRPTYKSGMVGKKTLGAFKVINPQGLEFTVGNGVGLTDAKRVEIWDRQDQWLGKIIRIKSKGGSKLKPRSPVYDGLRNPIDIG